MKREIGTKIQRYEKIYNKSVCSPLCLPRIKATVSLFKKMFWFEWKGLAYLKHNDSRK
jgi:hypothetical protein